MAHRIVFIPWTQAQAPDFGAQVASMDSDPDTHHQHTYEAVHYDDPHPNGVIANVGFGNRIYIRGHGAPGGHEIQTTAGSTLKYDDACDRLIEHGLKKTLCRHYCVR